MKLQSWNRFKTRAFAVEPALMGRAVNFVHSGSLITISIPPLSRVGDPHDEDALAIRGAWRSDTNEPIYFYIQAVDVKTAIKSEVDLPDAVLAKRPNAYELIDKGKQETLNAISESASSVASSAFEYWISLIQWVTGFHRVAREERVGYESGWSTYLREVVSDKPVWVQGMTMVADGVHALTEDEWQLVQARASAGDEPPMHVSLLQDAKHCMDVGDYRRALVDLSVACEVYLRNAVLDSLPTGVVGEVVRLIEDANINQYVSHMFPALLSDAATQEYKKAVKDDLSSLFARRNKLMHVAATDGASRENCARYQRALEVLFGLERRST